MTVRADSISSYDPKDPTAAAPRTRERAKASAESLLSTLDVNSSSPDLSSLRIGIPQVRLGSQFV